VSSVIRVSEKYGSKLLSGAPQGFLTYVWKRSRRTPAITALIGLLVALAVAIGWNIWRSELTHRSPTKGIAVLPFEDLSADPDNAYLADGIQEEILTRLTKIADLKVISRPSTQHYRTKPTGLAEIAKQLGVTNHPAFQKLCEEKQP